MYGKITTKKYLLSLISIVLLTDIVILLNIPFLRQISGFLCFTIIPGLLILHILKLDKIEFFKKIILSVGLSVVFLMFDGLIVNSFYPYISKPLSLESILISSNIILMILAFIAYRRNKNYFDIKGVFDPTRDLKDKLIFPLVFPIMFPFMTVFGTYLMNMQGNNIILFMLMFLIIFYVVLITLFHKAIPNQTYPIAILMISISLLLILPLRSNHIDSQDINFEYFFSQQVLLNHYWDASKFSSVCNACLSITILRPVYQLLINIDGEYIFKIIYNLIFSITPLCMYYLFKKYIGNLYAFLSSFFFISQHAFINVMYMIPRVEIAFFFFALAMMVFFDDEITKLNKRTLFIILLFAVVISHYSTTYIFFIVLFLSWLITEIVKKRLGVRKNLSATILVLFLGLIFLWYSEVTEVPFTSGLKFFEQAFMNLGNFFIEESRSQGISVLYGKGLADLPHRIFVIVFYITNLFIGIGCINLIKNYRNSIFGVEYISMMLVFIGIVLLATIFPFVSVGYNIIKLYLQALVLLAPMIIIGSEVISKYLHIGYTSLIILLILIPQFICGTYLIYQFFGVPHSYAFNSKGYEYDLLYVHDQEVVAAQWLGNHDDPNLPIYTDSCGFKRLIGHGCGDRWRLGLSYDKKSVFAEDKPLKQGYIFLRYQNVVDGIIIPQQSKIPFHPDKHNISEYAIFLKDKIYSNAGSEVYVYK